ncbi:MAG: NADH-quinone oxidoreductase subunit NuoN [Chitinophagales bacterium]|uniref:NADH-quinone oxidoreductase subunit N n=1 Tax=Arcobacter aquimarinus TaxID=1315211 RepID=A0AAE7B420_9BACT|nr:NADH-quinone oxidoreductase subunit NuoN [Arcobacter aquimarinus]MCB9032211.1 NADH-quinone oxidoreductase subunit NuoN [Chitinophagales bacterium]MCB9097018.1 NADH-quinone oxidoreductase subunit NuoN [Arcobacter sp.]QKE27093.1 NADH:quinone oxidoreductase I, membrane subunit N [Arcobacter aquimarinus]RXI35458.1 NADH-quinone oxidoreductase subunit NuoN [Arcobacter aquimarinus]
MIEPINVSLESLNLGTIVPMSVAIIGALAIILTDIFNTNKHKSLYVILVVLFLVFDLFTLLAFSGDERGVFDIMLLDGIAVLSQCIIIGGGILFVLLGLSKLRFQEFRYAEYFALYLLAIAGLQFMVSSDSLIMIFVGLETSSLALYTMIAMHNRMVSIEAAIKYFTMGALTAGFFVFGSMIFYAITGSVELSQIAQVVTQDGFLSKENYANYVLVLVGFVFMFAALGFKLSLFPYHTWVPDVYQGSTSAMAGFLSVVPKMAGFVVALRFFEIFIHANDAIIQTMLYVTVILTMTIPNLIALQQKDIKRMLAYSSISNAGMAMAAIVIGTHQATTALFLYWILFTITNFGAFGMLWLNRGKEYNDYESPYTFKKFSGLAQISPFTASILGLFLFALAGLPPFALFWGKMYLIASAVNAGHIALAVIIVLNSAIAAYYYLRPVSYMFLRDPEVGISNTKFMQNATTPMKSVVGLAVLLAIISILLVEPLLNIIGTYVTNSGF